MATILVLPNFRMDKTEAPDEWTGRACTAVRESRASSDVLVEMDRTGEEVWLPKRRLGLQEDDELHGASGTGQWCGAANACTRLKGHAGQHVNQYTRERW